MAKYRLVLKNVQEDCLMWHMGINIIRHSIIEVNKHAREIQKVNTRTLVGHLLCTPTCRWWELLAAVRERSATPGPSQL